MTEVRFYDPMFDPGARLIYSIISAKFRNKWIFVRHQNRYTWEIPAGHIEQNETAYEAARRELTEETGAIKFKLECVATYSVTQEGKTGYGKLYLADIVQLGPIPDKSEIAEITFSDRLPENLTHPDIQLQLFNKVVDYLNHKVI